MPSQNRHVNVMWERRRNRNKDLDVSVKIIKCVLTPKTTTFLRGIYALAIVHYWSSIKHITQRKVHVVLHGLRCHVKAGSAMPNDKPVPVNFMVYGLDINAFGRFCKSHECRNCPCYDVQDKGGCFEKWWTLPCTEGDVKK